MSYATPQFYDVVITGAGPVGLLLACELALAQCTVLVLEREHDPASPLKQAPFGLRGLSVPIVESLDRRGLLDALLTQAAGRGDAPGAAHWLRQPRRPAGHFAGIQFFHDQVEEARWPYRLPGPLSHVAVMMADLESVLAAQAEAAGVTILRGHAFEGFDHLDHGLAVRAGSATIRAGWLVGCDGARSPVRKAAGIGFTGTDPEFTGYSAQVELADPTLLEPGRHRTAHGLSMFTPPGTIGMVDFDGGACHRAAPITRDHIEAVLRRISGADVRLVAMERVTTWTDRAAQAATYRRGRVLLAGDAAHIHSPLGGQGLNLGLGDAMNLGWKLAATIRGDAPADLLDSYEAERHPVGARVLDWSRAQVALMRPDRGSCALEAVLRDLIATRDGATYMADRLQGFSLRYDLGGRHPLVGRSMPRFTGRDGTAIGPLLRDGRGLLLAFDPTPALEALAAPWRDRIRFAAVAVEDSLGLSGLLVRPDGIVAWASDGEPDPSDVTAATARWFGMA